MGHYLNRKGSEIVLLDSNEVSSINQGIDLWMNGKMMDTEDSFIKCVCSTFNMTLNQSKFEAIERIKELNIDFKIGRASCRERVSTTV